MLKAKDLIQIINQNPVKNKKLKKIMLMFQL